MDLQPLLEPVTEAADYELLLVEYIEGQRTLRLYIDRRDGAEVTVDDCAAVSEQVSGVLDVSDPITEEYRLEVSSPGTDRPLTKPAHFQRFAGERAKVQLYTPMDGRRRFTGLLAELNEADGVLNIEVDGELVAVPMADIERARLAPQF